VALKLTWETWTGLSDGDATDGSKLPEATLFKYALAVVAVLAIAYAVRLWKPLSIALTVGACILLGVLARVALDLYGTGGTFVDVHPGLGLWLAVGAALVLIVASKPIPFVLGAALVPLLAVAFWPPDGLDAGHIETAADKDIGPTLALDGDTILTLAPFEGAQIEALDPDGERYREVFDKYDLDVSILEQVAVVRQGDDLYTTVDNRGLMRIPLHGKPRMVAVGLVHPPGDPADRPQKVTDFKPSRLAAAPDGSVYVLSDSRVLRLARGKLEPFIGSTRRGFADDGTPAAEARFDAPQDIAVDRQGRLYIADTGNGRVQRVGADGKLETLLGSAAPPGCAQKGGDEPGSLDPTYCHAIEALAVDSHGNVFVATGGVPRVLAITAGGRYGVVAGTGLAGTATGDGRAVSARIGAVNALAIGPDDDLYIGEYERALRVADPLKGLGTKPASAPGPAAPRSACKAVADWGSEQLKGRLVAWTPQDAAETLVGAIEALDDDVPGAADLKRELGPPSDKQRALDRGGRANAALRHFGEESCGLFDGLYPISAEQGMRICTTYLTEWDQVDEFSPGDDRQRFPAARIAPFMPDTILPRTASRLKNWTGSLAEFARRACAMPYRWATRYAD
jgi:hypothetical protein